MATVNNLLTRINDVEAASSPTFGNIPAGGAGAAANTDIFLQAAQSAGKRITETAGPAGFSVIDGADNNVSAASVHVGVWLWVTHYAILDALRIALSTGTTPATNYDYWDVPLTEYPALGGFIRVWVDVSTPTSAVGTGLDETALRCFGVLISFTGAPGGNAANLIIDAADFTNGGAALSLTGTSGLWSDFTTADQDTTNQYGVFRTIGGVYNCAARVQLGTASSLVFSDSSFTIVFPQQSQVESTFMGITVDLQNASTNIDWANASISSAGTKQGDIVVTGTSGDFDATNVAFANIRVITLTSACTLSGCLISNSGQITLAGATMTSCTVINNTAASAVVASSPAGAALVSGCDFTSDGTGHAIEVTGTAADFTLTNNTYTGYGADGTTDAAIFVNIASGTAIVISITGGDTPTIRTAGVAVTVQNAVTIKITVRDANTLVAIPDARVLLEAGSVATGTHTGSNDVGTLTDGSQSFTPSALVGYRIYNTTDGSDGLITANDATTVTATLSGGTGNDWDTSDAYIIVAKPALNPVSIASVTTTATVTHRNHGLINGASVVIRGATEDEYNGIFTISNVTTNTYDYTLPADPTGSSANGSPTATAVFLSGVTGDGTPDPVGILQTTSFNYIIDQPITGKVRRATTGDLYKTGAITGTITSAGLNTTILLILDE
ncbi:MAG: hypothetical protein A2920_02240 [Candidatus Zambryskibacteria bacterium RIFCSPLOWO2_01_FULL_43_17]|uniref:Uncharacterized protein n=1 Tax=Candidatus Zambryskibacteria bacterium RIFCSPLOWO2_01_FULL_43_17 TaxID=1802760 RepID=A0A1G2U1W8_9BACT|nr:MAG: hypothetical protein A2920_02240 [Candidatus Zambryskibacteria bacterium RIFCSPLOWO2_01_FULL_43_17]